MDRRERKNQHTTVYFLQVAQEAKGMLVPKGNIDNTVMGQRGKGGVYCHFLSSTRSTGGNEDTGVLPSEGTSAPETTGGIPEGLLRNHCSVPVI